MQLQKAVWLLCILTPACASTQEYGVRHPVASSGPNARHAPNRRPEPATGCLTPYSSNGALAADAQLPELLIHARRNNPKLHAAFQAWRVAIEQIPQATKLPEPRLMFGVFLQEVETRTGPMQGKLSISQALPWFGKLRLAGKLADARAMAMAEGVEIAYLQVERQVKDAWYEYAWLQQAVLVAQAHRDLLSHWQNVARTRLELGLSQPSEILRVELELGQLEDRLMSLADLQRPLAARLNAVLNRPSDAPLAVPAYPLPKPASMETAALLGELANNNPRLRQLQRQVEAGQQNVALADKAGFPDFAVGVDYTLIGSNSMAGSGEDAVALTFGLSLPVWRTAYRAQREGARAELIGARAHWENARNEVTAELEMALFKLRDTSRHLELLNASLIPKGQEAIRIMGDTYQSGESSFIDVIDAQRLLLEFQLQAVRAEADRAQALSKVEQISGVSISASL